MRTYRKSEKKVRSIHELNIFMDKVGEKLDRVAEEIGGLSNNVGEVAEDYFFSELENRKKINGINFHTVTKRVRDVKNNEWDIVLTNGKTVAVFEVKQKPHINDVEKVIEKTLPQFRLSFPAYNTYKLLGGIAGMTVTKDVADKAQKEGLFVLTQNNKNFKVLNSKDFQPKTF